MINSSSDPSSVPQGTAARADPRWRAAQSGYTAASAVASWPRHSFVIVCGFGVRAKTATLPKWCVFRRTRCAAASRLPAGLSGYTPAAECCGRVRRLMWGHTFGCIWSKSAKMDDISTIAWAPFDVFTLLTAPQILVTLLTSIHHPKSGWCNKVRIRGRASRVIVPAIAPTSARRAKEHLSWFRFGGKNWPPADEAPAVAIPGRGHQEGALRVAVGAVSETTGGTRR